MKVAFVNIDDSLGGASIACLRLAEAINKQEGVEVNLFVQKKTRKLSFIKRLDKSFWGQKKAFARFIVERLYFYFFEKSKEIRFAFSPGFSGTDITKKINFKEYDVIHLHWINFGFLSLNNLHKLTRLNIPIVWTMHDMWSFTGGCHYSNDCTNYKSSCGNCTQFLKSPSQKDLSYRLLKKKGLAYDKNAKIHFVGCSKWIADMARKSSILQPFDVSSIPNVVPSNFKPMDKEVCRKKINLPANKTFILFVAMNTSDKRKGFSYLSEALLKVSKDYKEPTNIELLVIGNSTNLRNNNLPFKTHLLGMVSDLEEMNLIYNASDVFVIPSIQDNLPNTIMEAMATGTPCVGFNVGGIPEMIDHLKNGYVSDYKSPSSLSEGLKWVLVNNSYDLLCKEALKKTQSSYGTKAVSAKYMKVYKNLISQ